MAARPAWQGHLKLSLVTCPVALFAATTSANDVRFHLINPRTRNRIRMVPTDPDVGPVERADLVRGYEVSKDEYVLFDDADFDKVRLEGTRTLSIDSFVEEAGIDRLYWADPFFVVPEKGVGAEAFAVIRDAMRKQGKVALGRLVLRGKERQVALEPRGEGLIAHTLRAHDEVRDADDYFDDIPVVKPDPDMVEIAGRIIAQKEAVFDPTRFTDRYDDALREMIQAKSKGGKGLVEVAEPDDTNVVDLMEALKNSLKGSGAAKPRPGGKTGRPAKSRTSPRAGSRGRKSAA